MSHNNLHTLTVLWDNTLLIFSGILGWGLTLLGVDVQHMHSIGVIFTGDGWVIVDYVLNHAAVGLSCIVSLATLLKIKRELKGKKK